MAEKTVARRGTYQRAKRVSPEEWAERRQINALALGEAGGDFKRIPQAARKFNIPVAELRHAFFVAAGLAKGRAFRRAAMRTNEWKAEMDAQAVVAVESALERNEDYNRGRIGLGWLKGNGVLKEDLANIGIQNNLSVIVRNEEEARRFFELGRKAAGLPAGNLDGETAVVERADLEPNSERPAVVAEKCD